MASVKVRKPSVPYKNRMRYQVAIGGVEVPPKKTKVKKMK